ncbi:hypothetical protein J4421_00855 [Candidatus Woesearchaeota archaeon]|nr:hypothetical protein [Candidatus Woesearchaeota archaeon]
MSETIVCKFGGTSLATREKVDHVKRIINDDGKREYIVVSAPGSYKKDHDPVIYPKVTKLLKDLAGMERRLTDAAAQLLDAIAQRYENIYPGSKKTVASDLRNRFTSEIKDHEAYWANLLAAGEYWQGFLLAEDISAQFIDPTKFIKVSGSLRNARVLPVTYDLLLALSKKYPYKQKVIPGFYGATEEGLIGLLNEGGSDRTGSEVAVGVRAKIYENFSDYSVLAADPALVPGAKPIREMTQKELRDLAYSGFKILQQEAILPLQGTPITLHIRSTDAYPEEGTRVVEDRVSDPQKPIIGIAYKPGFCAFSIEESGVNERIGLLHEMLDVFARREIPVEFPPCGIDDISVILEQDQIAAKVSEIKQELADTVIPPNTERRKKDVEFTDNLGIVVMAGKGIARDHHLEALILSTLAENKIEIIAESKGVKRRCLIYVIPQSQGRTAVNALYNQFIEN